MKSNRSLSITCAIQDCKKGDIIGLLEEAFPSSIFDKKHDVKADANGTSKTTRDRIWTPSNTLRTMVLTAAQKDKSLKNSVGLFYGIHQKHKETIEKEMIQKVMEEQIMDSKLPRHVGKPKLYKVKLPKSLEKDISINTSAYSDARSRLPLELVNDLFVESQISNLENNYSHWHGLKVYLADGTYLQLQDAPKISETYTVQEGKVAFPQALLEVVVARGSGQIACFKMANRHTSELPLLYDMIDDLPVNALLLADDLYNCYEIIAKFIRTKKHLIVPAKRHRIYTLIEKLGEGDEIVEIEMPRKRSKWQTNENLEMAKTCRVRMMSFTSPDGNKYNLLTTILDKSISKDEFQMMYLTRWDIEIGIREIKTIMDINVLRAKTPEMALKELTVGLATYNLIRKIIYDSTKGLSFSPKEDIVFKYNTNDQDLLIDKKGRLYNQWGTGRKAIERVNSKGGITETKAK